MQPSAAQQALRQGDVAGALKLLQDQVRAAPQDAKLRVFLFQLLCVLGQWDRALNQLNVAGELDASTLAMVQTYRETIQCERLRIDVFAGKRVPMLFGEPHAWLALMLEALLREGRGEHDDARRLREQALEEAPTTSGSADGKAFEWITDADGRLGPVFEAIVNGRYYWIPASRLSRIEIDAPTDLRDSVWMPAHFLFSNGGEVVGFIPTRYVGSDSGDAAHALARRTDWTELSPGQYTGLGQRMLSTDVDDLALMDVRLIELNGDDA